MKTRKVKKNKAGHLIKKNRKKVSYTCNVTFVCNIVWNKRSTAVFIIRTYSIMTLFKIYDKIHVSTDKYYKYNYRKYLK